MRITCWRIFFLAALAASALFLSSCRPGADGPATALESGTVRPAGRVLILGLDGADWQIFERLEQAGRIPNLSRLRREGAHGVLRSERPLLSPIVWTTIATGRPPIEHGIHGFLTRRNGVEEPVRSDERNVRAFWNVATDMGLSVGVVGWYSSWPAERVNGFLISDRVGVHQVSGKGGAVTQGLVFPDELMGDIDRLVPKIEAQVAGTIDGFFEGNPLDPGGVSAGRMEAFRGILRTTELYRRLVLPLLARFEPDIAAVYFEGTDSVGHLFAEYEPPRLPWVSERQAQQFGDTFSRYYEYIDTVVGELLADLDSQRTTVMLISDHGFKSGARRPRTPSSTSSGNQAPLWHHPEGVLILWGRGIRRATKLPDSSVYDVLPTAFRVAGLPLALNLRGRPVDEAFTEELLKQPVRSVADYEAVGERERAPPGDDGDAAEQMAKLRALGYVGSGDSGSAASPGTDSSGGQAAIPLNRYNEAMILLNAGRVDEAFDVARSLQSAAPESPMGFLAEGVVQLRRGQGSNAVEPLRRALLLNPGLGKGYGYLGEALLATGRTHDARDAFERALRLDAAQGRTALLLAQLDLRQRRLDEARRWFEVARETSEETSDRARACIGLAVLAEERRQLGKAEQLYEEALKLIPDFPPALERFANLSLYREQPGRAVDLLERLVALRPNSPGALASYGRALAATGRNIEARAALTRSLAVDPDQADTRRLLDELSSRRTVER